MNTCVRTVHILVYSSDFSLRGRKRGREREMGGGGDRKEMYS